MLPHSSDDTTHLQSALHSVYPQALIERRRLTRLYFCGALSAARLFLSFGIVGGEAHHDARPSVGKSFHCWAMVLDNLVRVKLPV
jgi:hypothetical protein